MPQSYVKWTRPHIPSKFRQIVARHEVVQLLLVGKPDKKCTQVAATTQESWAGYLEEVTLYATG